MVGGPFDISYDQIQRLGPRFTEFVNKLLEAELAAHAIPAHQLTITMNEDAADGGVDAALRNAPSTNWLPSGDTAFQFKRAKQTARECAAELEKATHAHTIISAGGNYVVALGQDGVPDQSLSDRHEALLAKAIALGLLGAGDGARIRVYGADDLARWATQFPALAIDPILESLNPGAIDYRRWRRSRGHDNEFVPDDSRIEQINELRDRLVQATLVDMRLQGDSGIGKTRLAMEALDDERFRSLVAYISDATQIGGGLIESLIDRGRHVILVVDDCPAAHHVKLVERLDTNPSVKLITIGDVGTARSSGPALGITTLEDSAMDKLLRAGFPLLSNEARRFVRDHSHGSPGHAIWLARAVEQTPDAQAAELIARDDITTFVTKFLPEGDDFFYSAVLALFERVGWDRDVRIQMELLAAFAGATPDQFESLVRDLSRHGLVHHQGRFRAIHPLPVAIFLAAEGWRQFGPRIVDELLPQLPDDIVLALFRRAGDLGRFDPAAAVLPKLMAPGGPFGSFQAIEENKGGELLTQLAIVVPEEVAAHLGLLIESESLDSLLSLTSLRRSLVWTLEKLAWHTSTFETAADALLRLALAESESYANNATGTFLDLFGNTLPATAALPAQRLAYLERVSRDPRPEVKRLVAQAAQRGLGHHESVMVAAEIQGGVLVEPRGTPNTWKEVGEYRVSLLRLLDRLRHDADEQVAQTAARALLDAVHPLLDDPFVGSTLTDVLAGLTGDWLRSLRVELEHLANLHARQDIAPEASRPALVEAIGLLRAELPPMTRSAEIEVLLELRDFDLEGTQLIDRMTEIVAEFSEPEREALIKGLSRSKPAAYQFGRALAAGDPRAETLTQGLADHLDTNPNALLGYLTGLVELGDEFAFDSFLDGPVGRQLTIQQRLGLAVRGPVTTRARERVMNEVENLPVRDAAAALFAWNRNLDANAIGGQIRVWSSRIDSQDEYDVVLDWADAVIPDGPLDEVLAEPVWDLVRMRARFPRVGRQAWHWARLAMGQVPRHSAELLALVLDLLEQDVVTMFAGDEEARLIEACLRSQPERGWTELASRLEGPNVWRIAMQVQGWIEHALVVDDIDRWIGGSVERARVIAGITHPGGSEPTAFTRLLLGRFDDPQVKSSLQAAYTSGSWTGPWSERITGQIDQLTGWVNNTELSLGVRSWAKETIDRLRLQRDAVREREEEGRF